MESKKNLYIAVAYELSAMEDGKKTEMVETASVDKPFQFISGLGIALDAFEEKVSPLKDGERFDFVLEVDEAYGSYEEEHVLTLDKSMFCIDGHFDSNNIYPGNVIPLTNEGGNRFYGLVLEVTADHVVLDLNHPLAGKRLHFKGEIVSNREATNEEITATLKRMSGEEECGCGCHHHGEEEHGGCGCHHHGEEEHGGCGCHHHGEEEHGGCGCHHHDGEEHQCSCH